MPKVIFIGIKAAKTDKRHTIGNHFPAIEKKSKGKFLFCGKKVATANPTPLESRSKTVLNSFCCGIAIILLHTVG